MKGKTDTINGLDNLVLGPEFSGQISNFKQWFFIHKPFLFVIVQPDGRGSVKVGLVIRKYKMVGSKYFAYLDDGEEMGDKRVLVRDEPGGFS